MRDHAGLSGLIAWLAAIAGMTLVTAAMVAALAASRGPIGLGSRTAAARGGAPSPVAIRVAGALRPGRDRQP